MNAKIQFFAHMIVAASGVTAAIQLLPNPWDIYIGAAWAALVAAAAFINQAISKGH